MYFAYFFKPGRQILQILVIEMIVNLLFLILKYLENNRIYRKFVCEAITFENRAKIDFYNIWQQMPSTYTIWIVLIVLIYSCTDDTSETSRRSFRSGVTQ